MVEQSGLPDEPLHDSLRMASSMAKWTGPAAIGGIALLVIAIVLAFVAPHPIWFLLYPLLIVAAVAVLTTAAAWHLRHF